MDLSREEYLNKKVLTMDLSREECLLEKVSKWANERRNNLNLRQVKVSFFSDLKTGDFGFTHPVDALIKINIGKILSIWKSKNDEDIETLIKGIAAHEMGHIDDLDKNTKFYALRCTMVKARQKGDPVRRRILKQDELRANILAYKYLTSQREKEVFMNYFRILIEPYMDEMYS